MQLRKISISMLKAVKKCFVRKPKVGDNESQVPSKYAFVEALRPLLIPLTLVGIQPKMEQEDLFQPKKKRRPIRWWNIFALLCLHAFSLKALVDVVTTSGGLDIWIQLTTFLRSSAAAVSADVYLLKQETLIRFFGRMSHMYTKLKVRERRGFRRRVRLSAALTWLFLVAYMAASFVAMYKTGIGSFLVGFSLLSGYPAARFILCFVTTLVLQLVMWFTVSFMIVLYISLCDAIKLSFRFYTQYLIKAFSREHRDADTVSKARRYFDYLSDLVTQMDDAFSPAVFFWYSTFILSVCIDITFDVALYGTVVHFPLLVSVLRLGGLFTAYAVIGLSASLATEESQKCVDAFFKLTTSWSSSDSALHLFSLHLCSTQPALTGWKFFTLNRSYMMTVIGILVSYVIIVVQLNPWFMNKIING